MEYCCCAKSSNETYDYNNAVQNKDERDVVGGANSAASNIEKHNVVMALTVLTAM